MSEHSFSYVLRHTQMRPRQLIILCNEIAECAIKSRNFPRFSESDIRAGIAAGEVKLASEILNAYAKMFPNAGRIIKVLSGLPMVFKGNELDRRAHESAAHWKNGTYTNSLFIDLVVQLGVVGRVRRSSGEGHHNVEFQYAQESDLLLSHRDDCAIHPMFFSKIGIIPESRCIIHPYRDSSVDDSWLQAGSLLHT